MYQFYHHKDYLGHELRPGDHVVTMVVAMGGGTYFVTAQIDYMTRSRIYLKNWASFIQDRSSLAAFQVRVSSILFPVKSSAEENSLASTNWGASTSPFQEPVCGSVEV